MIIVSDTSPITSLSAIGKLNLLQQIYGTIIIPQAVYEEMAEVGYPVPGANEVTTLSWIETRQVKNQILVAQLQSELDRGESEAIALAIELNSDLLIIDENPGRSVANRLGINFIGILGILLIAKQTTPSSSSLPWESTSSRGRYREGWWLQLSLGTK